MKKTLLSVLALLAFTFGGTAQTLPSYVPANGLVGWWPFNGNANDESGNNNNGTVNGATLTADRFGNAGKAYVFDGVNDLISVQDHVSLRPSILSIAFWYKKENDNPSQLIYKGSFSNASGEQYSINSSYSFGIKSGSGCISGTGWHNLVTPNNTGTNQWKFITGTFNGTELKLYDNGMQLSTLLFSGNIDDCAGGSLTFGASWAQYPYFFSGSLDDIAIWNRALSQQEIIALYNATNCAGDLSISPASGNLNSGSTTTFSANTTDPNPQYRWQSDLGIGFQNLSNYGQFSGVSSSSMQVSNLQLRNHQQKFRVISTSGNCVDTSDVATIVLNDTCINIVNDTNLITVTDTLLIQTITNTNPVVSQNTLKVWPNPGNTAITLDAGNLSSMQGWKYKVANTLGQTVVNETAINQQQTNISLSTWGGNGIYYLHLINPQGHAIEIKKIVLAP